MSLHRTAPALSLTPGGAHVFFDQQAGRSAFIVEAHRIGKGCPVPQIAPFPGNGWTAIRPDAACISPATTRPSRITRIHPRMRAWDNGNHPIWCLPLAPWLAAHRTP
jgi:hypothetical protein